MNILKIIKNIVSKPKSFKSIIGKAYKFRIDKYTTWDNLSGGYGVYSKMTELMNKQGKVTELAP